jgi:hypothetical protein
MALHGLSSERPRVRIRSHESGSKPKSVALVCYICRANREIDCGRVSLWKTGARLTTQAAQAEVQSQGRFHLSPIIVAVDEFALQDNTPALVFSVPVIF